MIRPDTHNLLLYYIHVHLSLAGDVYKLGFRPIVILYMSCFIRAYCTSYPSHLL